MFRQHFVGALATLLITATAATTFAQDAVSPPATTSYAAPYKVDKHEFEGRFITPSATPASMPVIVLFPDWMGFTKRATDDAKKLVAMGYGVFVADPYGKGARPKNAQEAARVSGALKKDVVKMREIARAALHAAKQQPGVDTSRVAAVGYCFGGTVALELARSGAPLQGVAVVHGNLKTPFPDDAGNIKGRVLALHGAADPHVPPEEVEAFKEEMNNAGVNFTLVEYPGAMHAFTNPKADNAAGGVMYDETASEAAYTEMERFFADVLEEEEN